MGSWNTIYIDDTPVGERDIHYVIGGSGHIQGRIDPGGICYAQFGGFMPGSYSGWGELISEDPYVFEAYVDIYCFTDRGRQLGFEDWHMLLQYEPATDTIISLNYPPEAPFNCAWRTGSDPSCVTLDSSEPVE